MSDRPPRRKIGAAGGIGLDHLEPECLGVERRAGPGVADPEHGVVQASNSHATSLASMSSSIDDLVADEHAAGLERRVPLDAEVLAVDRAGRREPGLGVAPRVLADAAELEVERDRPGDALDRQVAVQLVVAAGGLDAGRAERHRRVVLDVEEVVRAQVVVAALVAGVDRGHLHDGGDRRVQRVVLVTMSAVKSVNRPRTLDTIMWRTLKPTVLWEASSSQMPAGIVEVVVVGMGGSSREEACDHNYITVILTIATIAGRIGITLVTMATAHRTLWLDDEEMAAWRAYAETVVDLTPRLEADLARTA